MKRFFYLIGLAVLAAMIFGCDQPSGGCDRPQTIQLTEADNGKVIEMKLGNQIKIVLPSNATTGFSWENVLTEGSIMVQVGESVYTIGSDCGDPPRPGCGGTQTFTFEPVSVGTGKIKLIYHQSWSSEEPAKQFEVTVIVN